MKTPTTSTPNFNKAIFLVFLTLAIIDLSAQTGSKYYWVGGTGIWNDPLNHWATTSGGSTFHPNVPGSQDTVYFDANSFSGSNETVSLNVTEAFCAAMYWQGVTGNPTFEAIGTTKKLYLSGSLEIDANMTFNFGGTVYLLGEAAGSPHTIKTNGNLPTIYTFRVDNNGTYKLLDDFTMSRYFYLVDGTFELDGHRMSVPIFQTGSLGTFDMQNAELHIDESLTGTASFSIGNLTWLGSGGKMFFYKSGTVSCGNNFDVDRLEFIHAASSSSPVLTGTNANIRHLIFPYQGIITGTGHQFERIDCGGNFGVGPTGPFATLTVDSLFLNNEGGGNQYVFYAYVQVNDTLGIKVGTCAAPNLLTGSPAGTFLSGYTNNATGGELRKDGGSVDVDFVNIRRLPAISQNGAVFNATNVTQSFNTYTGWNVTFRPAQDYYWVGGTGDWTDPTQWSLTSGGTPQAADGCVPDSYDNVLFDANSFDATGQVVTLTTNALCHDMDWTGTLHAPSLQSNNLYISGSLTLNPNMNFNPNQCYFRGFAGNFTINTNGALVQSAITIDNTGYPNMNWQSHYDIIGDFESTGGLIIQHDGSFTTNNNNIICNYFFVGKIGTPPTANLGSSVIEITGAAYTALSQHSIINSNGAVLRVLPVAMGGSISIGAGISIDTVEYLSTTGTSYLDGGLNTHIKYVRFKNQIAAISSFDSNNGIANIEKLVSEGDVQFWSALVVDSLLLNGSVGGHTYQFGSSGSGPATLTIKQGLKAEPGTCSNPNIFRGFNATNYGKIEKTSGDISVDFASFYDMKTMGGATFTVNNTIFENGNNPGWTFNLPAGRALYWIGDGGNWDDLSHWSLSSGGAPLGGIDCSPLQTDTVVFDANSFSMSGQIVTVGANKRCAAMTWQGVLFNPTFTDSSNGNFYVHGSIALDPNMVWDMTDVTLWLLGGAGIHDLDLQGHVIKYITRVNTDGEYRLLSDFNSVSGLYLEKGGFDTNNQDMDCTNFDSNYSTVRSIKLGSSAINLTSNASYSFRLNNNNLTLDAGTSIFEITYINSSSSANSANFSVGGNTNNPLSFHQLKATVTGNAAQFYVQGNGIGYFDKVEIFGKGGIQNVDNAVFDSVLITGKALLSLYTGAPTFNYASFAENVNFSGGDFTFGHLSLNAPAGGKLYQIRENATVIIQNSFTASPGTCANPNIWTGHYPYYNGKIQSATAPVNLDFVELNDIHVSGGAAFTANNVLDENGNNSGWTINFPAGRDLYWVGGAGTWNDVTKWSLSSGGTPLLANDCGPTQFDNVFFDANSFSASGQTVTVPSSPVGKCTNMDWTGAGQHQPNFSLGGLVRVRGSLTLENGMLWNGPNLYLVADSGVQTIKTDGVSITSLIYIDGGAEFQLMDDLVINYNPNFISLNIYDGTFNTQNYNISCSGGITIGAANGLNVTAHLGSSVITSNGPFTVDHNSGNTILDAGTSKIILTGNTTVNTARDLYDVEFMIGGKLQNQGINLNFHHVKFHENGQILPLFAYSSNYGFCEFLKKGTVSTGNYDKCVIGEKAEFRGSSSFDTLLLLYQGSQLTHLLEHSKTQTVNDSLYIGSNGCTPMTLQSGALSYSAGQYYMNASPNPSYIAAPAGKRHDLDFLVLKDVNATGAGELNAGLNSDCPTGFNCTGWLYEGLPFTFDLPTYVYCTTSFPYSLDVSGNPFIIGYEWGNSTTGPVLEVDSAGVYTVNLFAGVNCSQSVDVEVNIIPSTGTITGPAIVEPGSTGVAYSTTALAGAVSYLWQYTGTGATIIGNTNSVTLDFGNYSKSGALSVTPVYADCQGPASAPIIIDVVCMGADILPPLAYCKNEILNVQLNAVGFAAVSASQIDSNSIDNCAIASFSLSDSTFYCGAIGPQTLTLTVTDSAGHMATCNATVNIVEAAPGACGPLVPFTKFWGLTSGLSNGNIGSIVSLDPDGNNFNSFPIPTYNPGQSPLGDVILAVNGKFYGMTSIGGENNEGVLFEYDPAGNGGMGSYLGLHHFTSATGDTPQGSLLESGGKLYGMTEKGGSNDWGVIFEYDISGTTYSVLYDFDPPTGAFPRGSLIEWNGKFYGTTRYGSYSGVLFEFNPIGNVYTVLFDFDSNSGREPWGDLLVMNNKFYGTTNLGGNNDKGVLFEYNPAGAGTYTIKHHFDQPAGENPTGSLIESSGSLYGMTPSGGTFDDGVIFKYDVTGNSYTVLHHFTSNTGRDPYGDLMESGGKFYGMTPFGGNNNKGVLFEYDPAGGGTYTVEYNFDPALGGEKPFGSLIASGGKFYGMTAYGGNNGHGVFFEYDPAGNYSTLVNFNSNEAGALPRGNLIEWNGKLYGLTESGGNYGGGGLFEFDTTGSGDFIVKHHFEETTGHHPQGSLIELNGKLYGMTNQGGNFDGVIFEYDTAGTYAVRHHFESSTGHFPHGSLIVYNDALYGMTRLGGTSGGVIFKFDPAANGGAGTYEVIHNFSMAGGHHPYGSLLALNGKFYGMTNEGGNTDDGVVFEFDPVSNTFLVLHHFVTGSGINPWGDLVEANSKLYGMTSHLESNDFKGVLFEFDPSANSGNGLYAVLHPFAPATGSSPYGSLSRYGSKLYGMTYGGGAVGVGTIFEYDLIAAAHNVLKELSPADARPYGSLFLQTNCTQTVYADNDGDGYGDPLSSLANACTIPLGYVFDGTDCNDSNPDIYPGAPELCNGLDNNCDGNPEGTANTWNGEGNGLNWNDPDNWSDGLVPLSCQDVIIPAGATVQVAAGQTAVGRTLFVHLSAELSVDETAIMTIEN